MLFQTLTFRAIAGKQQIPLMGRHISLIDTDNRVTPLDLAHHQRIAPHISGHMVAKPAARFVHQGIATISQTNEEASGRNVLPGRKHNRHMGTSRNKLIHHSWNEMRPFGERIMRRASRQPKISVRSAIKRHDWPVK